MYACTPHTSEKTAGYVHQHIKFFPRRQCCHVWAILQWLQTHAFWKGSQYSSCCLPERFSPNGITGAWCQDWSAVCQLWDMSCCDCPHCSLLNPSPAPSHSMLCVCSHPVKGGLPASRYVVCAETDQQISSAFLPAVGSMGYPTPSPMRCEGLRP